MALDKSLKEKMRRITSKAALAASKFKGLNDKIGADKAAVDIMRAELNDLNINGRVVTVSYTHLTLPTICSV